tara:strand:- start:338 stop:1594 length:1257 start_codon:yes stop_codon:yes gene_type:complete
MPEADKKYEASPVRARSSIKSLNFELANLTPSSMIQMFEIDLTDLLNSKGFDIVTDATKVGFNKDIQDGILRFHNNIRIFNSYIMWQGKTYYPAPITAEGFESTSKGTLPQPLLTIASQSETGVDQLALLKFEIRQFGDIIGAKVTRRRTFAKYLDRRNFIGASSARSRNSNVLPDGYEPDPYAELPKDVYFIERKQTENKNVIAYQLSSVLDLEGLKLPKRMVVADKCVWQYRGMGCWYQHAYQEEIDAGEIPLLEKAELGKLGSDQEGKGFGLPFKAPPCANDKNEKISSVVNKSASQFVDKGLWNSEDQYSIGDYVYLEKDKIKFYFVCKKGNGGNTLSLSGAVGAIRPPNTEYWVADECSKSLTGCRMRWGASPIGNVQTAPPGGTEQSQTCGITKGELPYGGFPAARKMSRLG